MSVAKLRFTPEQYLELERKAAYKSEFLHGEIFAMAGVSYAHSVIATNLALALQSRMARGPCRTIAGDLRVCVDDADLYTYPDVLVVCGKPEFSDSQFDTLANPKVIAEVLSPSTEAYDRGEKFSYYRRLQSLTDYLLVAQDRMRVEHYARQGAQWLLTVVEGAEAVLTLASLGCEVPLSGIYDGVDLLAPETSPPPSNGSEQ
jgi:Uma2 family endonuclease